MKTLPDYTKELIVAVIFKDQFNWYVSNKELWFMDYEKWADTFRKNGYEANDEYIDERRKGLLVLDSDVASKFLIHVKQDKVTASDLQEGLLLFRSEFDDDWVFDYRPSLYINFDEKKFYSNYSEPASYEEFIPSHWQSGKKDFKNLVPVAQRYWLSPDGKDYLIPLSI